MRAFVVKELGQPGEVTDLPDPEPAEGEILVRVRKASVNPMDAFVTSGGVAQWAEVRMPLVPGLDAVGTVETLGDGVTGFKPGDDVVVTAATKPYYGAGTFAELVTVPSSAAVHMPAGIDDATAASVPQTGLTALAAAGQDPWSACNRRCTLGHCRVRPIARRGRRRGLPGDRLRSSSWSHGSGWCGCTR
jgi:NADPH:quinone reductase-like Zn-dependent oxidoreductase